MRFFVLLLLLLVLISPIRAQDAPIPRTYMATYHQQTGNRYVDGHGTFPDVLVQDFVLGGIPTWVVGADTEDGPIWWVVLTDGSIQRIGMQDNVLRAFPLEPEVLPPGMPPVLIQDDAGVHLWRDLPESISPLTHPVFVEDGLIYVSAVGDIVRVYTSGEETHLASNALPDARIVLDSAGERAALYIGATDQRYVHGIMGDTLEAAALVVLDTATLSELSRVTLQGDEVFEGIMPMWADVNADGTEDLLTTVSFSGGGAQYRVYNSADGHLIAQNDPIGLSNRWRHQLAWGAFGSNGENELVEVLTPHIGGVTGFHQFDGNTSLNRIATFFGYTSHNIGSRNLDMAVAGDFNGDGQPEIVLPWQNMEGLGALQHTTEGEVTEVWSSTPFDGRLLYTNLFAVNLGDGGLTLAAGIVKNDEAWLRVWLPNGN